MMIEKYPSYNFDNFFSLKLFYERCQLIFVHSSGFPFYRVVPLLLILMNEPVGLTCQRREFLFQNSFLKTSVSDPYHFDLDPDPYPDPDPR